MANSVIDTEMIVLQDNWPFDPGFDRWAGPYRKPAVDSLLWEGQNVSTLDKFRLGRKFVHYEPGGTGKLSGWSTFIYLKLGTQHTTLNLSCVAATVKCVCTTEGTLAENSATAATQLYQVTNDGDATTMESLGLCAIATSAMTDTYYGWFWCGGVAPLTLLTGLVGDVETDQGITGPVEIVVSATDETSEPLGLSIASAGVKSCGFSTLKDDT